MFHLNAQECGFETPENYQTYEDVTENRLSNSEMSYCLNICFRILRDDNGTNAAMNPSMIPQILNQLNTYFNPHNIYFKQVGTYDYINNTKYNNRQPEAIDPINKPNCINLYFIKSFGVNANGQPSNVIGLINSDNISTRIKGSYPLNGNTAHEVGHILNLLHTFECSSFPSATCIPESPYTSNGCETKGDKICDTSADYNPTSSDLIPPPFPINSYNPDKSNLMSYWSNRNRFTVDQGSRMRSAIIGANHLQSVRSYDCAKIVGSSRHCKNQTIEYYVSGAEFNSPTFNWSVTNSLQIIGSTTNSNVTIKRLSNTGIARMMVLINGTTMKSKRVFCNFFSRLVGTYDWVSKDYGNMGLIVPIENDSIGENDDPAVSYLWEIKENKDLNTNSDGIKPYFIGSSSNESNKYESQTNQAVVNWGNSSSSYLISCHEITQSGEKYLISENYVDVGDPKNNPCFKDAFQTIIAPNPVKNGQLNVIINKPDNTSPCNYKNLDEPQFFNSELDKINNSITIFDYYGNQIYSNVFDRNEFTIENLNLISGNNYVVNLFTNEGGFRQLVIIAE